MALAPGTRLFGTDGVRGVAGEFLTAELAFELGRAGAAVCEAPSPHVLVVRDTRLSGEMLEAALCAGVAAAGGQALLAGVLPTPAASILVRRYGFDLGVVISASHNPFRDNGIKFFGAHGRKLSDQAEAAVEAHVHAGGARAPGASPEACGRVRALKGAHDDYLRELESRFDMSLQGRRVALDCANGATYEVAPALFERLGAEVDAIGREPDGLNINAGCGSTHMEALVQRVRGGGHDLGFAFDGDGDRMLAVARDGSIVDGDEIIAEVALDLKRRNELAGDGVAVTVMTNFGFHRAMRDAGIEVATTDVGDRHVVEELARRGWVLGGEQSGHIVDMRLTPSGDGIAAAMLLLQALGERPLESGAVITKLPQVLTNVRVADRDALSAAASVWEAVDSESAELEGEGRVLVRPSGTEPVVRVMVEAPTRERCEAISARVAAVVERELGRGVTA
ncbi:MAG: phosphoglucosamine mutase [Solirubrobacterales bacterium]